ncbi:MAG: phage tail sheath subtilisin-like domain-containing protein [Solibacillus sp.]|uniref:phage tail sheath subtilisin-like domain-containing protein n=1 Tax=Solibacillus sp. TaxID=1909654 RepID=UPI0033147056
MGLPEIDVLFKSKSVTAIKRSALGIVALILRDETANYLNSKVTIKSVEDLKVTDWTPENYDYINKTLLGIPSKIEVIRIPIEGALNEHLKVLGSTKFNYAAMPGANEAEAETFTSWIKSKRANDKKTFKGVVANQVADDEGIINFTTGGIKIKEKEYTAQQYTCRIAGILAGIPFTRSSTYFVLSEVDAIEEHEDPNADIDAGQLILINDGEQIKVGRGVNSLTTLTGEKNGAWQKIKIVEVMDIITDDVRDTFDKGYVGKYTNIYDNQILFIIAINAYLKGLAGQQILDPSYENTSFIDAEAQRLAWKGVGEDTSDWSDQQVREMSFGSKVFLGGQVKISDAMEDLKFNILSAGVA